MSEPRFRLDRGIATLTCEDGIEIVVDRFHEDRRTSEVLGEASYFVGSNGTRQLVHRGRLNLTSTRSRQDVERLLRQRQPRVAWGEILEQAALRVTDAVRAGRPASLLRDAPEPPVAGELLPPLLVADDPVVLFGDGGTGKSQLALALALSVHTGRAYAGLQPTRPMRVAYLDFEWRAWPHRQRMQRLCGDDELPDLLYVPCGAEGALSAQVQRLQHIISEHSVEYIVLDSVALACAGPPEEAATALDFFSALARLALGSCLVAHVNRGGDRDKPFGSAFWSNSARSTWYIEATQDPGQPRLDLALHHRKVNDGGKRHSLALHMEFGAQRTRITPADIHKIPEFADDLPAKERIAAVLKAGPLGVHELADRLDIAPDSVSKALRRDEGRRFVRVPDTRPDKWALCTEADRES